VPEGEAQRVRVAVEATDPVSLTGLTAYLQPCSEVAVLPADQRAKAQVRVVATDRLSSVVVSGLRRAATQAGTPVVLVINEISAAELLTAVECRVVAIVPRAAMTGDGLVRSVLTAASGGGVMPPSLVGELLKQFERLQREALMPDGSAAAGLTSREIDVLRLIAEGFDTGEIASQLCYSERTIKNMIYGVTHRFKLRSRSHAVAYALRAGVI
jgi:DNA-binding NarL/FixJ family response regulator